MMKYDITGQVELENSWQDRGSLVTQVRTYDVIPLLWSSCCGGTALRWISWVRFRLDRSMETCIDFPGDTEIQLIQVGVITFIIVLIISRAFRVNGSNTHTYSVYPNCCITTDLTSSFSTFIALGIEWYSIPHNLCEPNVSSVSAVRTRR